MSSSDKNEKQSQKDANYTWEDTELKHGNRATISIKELKQLLITRGEQKKNLKGNKSDLIKLLKQNHVIKLKNNIQNLTCNAILVELKLRGLNCKNAKKAVLISRLQSFSTKKTVKNKNKNKNNDNKINKRIPWEHTEICTFSVSELKQLLITRGAKAQNLPDNETTLIKLLKEKYRVQLEKSNINHLTSYELRLELLLNGASNYQYRYSKKAQLINGLHSKIKYKIARRKWIYISWNKNSSNLPHYISKPIVLNVNEFIVATNNALWKYNIFRNKWDIWIPYGEHKLLPGSVVCFDKTRKLIYVLGYHTLLTINYETKNINCMKNSIYCRNNISTQIFFVHQQLHVIGRSYDSGNTSNVKHFILNTKENVFNMCHEFDTNVYSFELVHLSTQNQVILICSDAIYSYSTNNHKWTQLSLKIPASSCYAQFSCVVTGNDKFVILFGTNGDNIEVIDMENMNVIQCSIRCPFKKNHAVIVNDQMKDELISFGYVRDCFKSQEIGMDIFPPQYIIRLIQLWCSEEFIHLFSGQRGWNRGIHCKIRVNDIINDAINSHKKESVSE